MMTVVDTNEQTLRDHGYVTHHRGLFINRETRKAFSFEFAEDAPEPDLLRCIREPHEGPGWRFYFNEEPSDYVRRELERVLENGAEIPG